MFYIGFSYNKVLKLMHNENKTYSLLMTNYRLMLFHCKKRPPCRSSNNSVPCSSNNSVAE